MTGTITSTLGTITANTPALSATQTWNSAGVTFKGISFNVTNTASAAASRLFDFSTAALGTICNLTTAGTLSAYYINAYTELQGYGATISTYITQSGNCQIESGGNTHGVAVAASKTFGWSQDANPGSAQDTAFGRSAAGVVEVNSGTAGTYRALVAKEFRFAAPTSANGQSMNIKSLTEATTIAAAATTDTTIQIPANSIVLAVSVRVTTVIPTAATFTVGDSGIAARFSTAAVSSAATSTDPGTKAGAYYNASALSVRITPNLTPGAATGVVRVTIHYIDVTVPTS